MAAKARTEELRAGWLRLAVEWQAMITPSGHAIAPGSGDGILPGHSESRQSDQPG